MSILDPLLVTAVLIVMGAINLASGALIFFSCRCLPPSKLGSKLVKHRWYQRFNKYHCYIWRVFWSSVMIHTTLATIHFWAG